MKKIKHIMGAISATTFVPTLVVPLVVSCGLQQVDWVDDSIVNPTSSDDVWDESLGKWKSVFDFSNFIYNGEANFTDFINGAEVTEISFLDASDSTRYTKYDIFGSLYDMGKDNKFGIRFVIVDDGELPASTYLIDKVVIKFDNKSTYKQKKGLQFGVTPTNYEPETGHTFNFPRHDRVYDIDDYDCLHASKTCTGYEVTLWQKDGANFVPLNKDETDIVLLTFNKIHHCITISFKPETAIWPTERNFYLGIKANYSDKDPIDIIRPSDDVAYNITNPQKPDREVRFAPGINPEVGMYGQYFQKDKKIDYDPATLASYSFDLSDADGDWNYEGHNISHLIFSLSAYYVSFVSDYSRVKLALYDDGTLVHNLLINTHFVWYQEDGRDELRFTTAGVQEILTGIQQGYTLKIWQFRAEQVRFFNPSGYITPRLYVYDDE